VPGRFPLLDGVFVSTEKDMLTLAEDWLGAGRPSRMVWWEQATRNAGARGG